MSYSANLTPDENTVIGSWLEDTFIGALRTGRHMGVSRRASGQEQGAGADAATECPLSE